VASGGIQKLQLEIPLGRKGIFLEDKHKEILEYSRLDRAAASWQFILGPIISFLIAFASLVLAAFAAVMLQDLLVGHVRDSHYSAWLYGVLPAGALALIGIAVSASRRT
jgi:hypothetical protein